jgi:integrase
MPRRITEAVAAALAAGGGAKDVFVFDSLLSGYALRRTPAGAVIHLARARASGRKVTFSLGRWPDVRTGDARELARLAITDIREGRDPAHERRVRQQAALAGGTTLATLAEKWLDRHVRAKLKPRTVSDYEGHLRRYILPALGHRFITEISRSDASALHVSLKATPSTANHVLVTLRAAMNFAVEEERLRSDNPAGGIKLFPEKPSERFLSPQEFRRAIDAIDRAATDGAITIYAAAGLKLCAYTGARRGEICTAFWRQVDFERKILRLQESKTGARTIHLNDSALSVLRALPRQGPQIVFGRRGTALSNDWAIVRARCGLDDVRLHDLRHSYASFALAAGVPLAMVGRLLGHVRPETTAKYAHLAESDVAAANDAVGNALAAAITPPPGGTVVKLPTKSRSRR